MRFCRTMALRVVLAALSVTMVLSCTIVARARTPATFLQCEPLAAELLSQSIDPDAAIEAAAEENNCDGLIIERSGQVPICLLEGASAVADPVVHDTDGTAIEEASGSCPALEGVEPIASAPDEGPTDPPRSGPHACLPAIAALVMLPHAPLGSQAPAAPLGAPALAHRTRIFRPPRS